VAGGDPVLRFESGNPKIIYTRIHRKFWNRVIRNDHKNTWLVPDRGGREKLNLPGYRNFEKEAGMSENGLRLTNLLYVARTLNA